MGGRGSIRARHGTDPGMIGSSGQAFARRVADERERRNWSMRELAAKAGVSLSTVSRVEAGHEVWLSAALSISSAFGVSIAQLTSQPRCDRCYDMPPPGFTCNACTAAQP